MDSSWDVSAFFSRALYSRVVLHGSVFPDVAIKKLDFLDNFFYNLALFAPQNCNDPQNQSKKAYFRPENCQKRKNSTLKFKNLI